MSIVEEPTDVVLRDGVSGDRNVAGPVAVLAGVVVSIVLFSHQTGFTGFVARAVPEIGDIGFEVGFLVAAAVHFLMRRTAPAR